MSQFKHMLLALMGMLLIAGSAWSQVSRGTITGTVTDPSGAVVPGVAIKVTNTATGVTNNVITNSTGNYTAPLLPTGTYSVTAEKTGFRRYIQSNVIVPVGETVRVDISMALGATTQAVQVTSAPLLKRDSSDLGTTITSREVEELPLTSFGDQRTPATFMQLVPGVTGRGPSNNNFAGMSRTMSTMVSGSMVSSTTLTLDGADIPTSNEFEGDLRALQIPPDAIQEFKLEAIMAPAEYGRTGGGTASFVVKSGTNQIHGTAFEFLRNDALNARNFFQPDVTPYKQNEFGATAGGPIKKDKAFIFGWYDGFRLSEGVSTGLATVPTEAMKQGDFRDFGTTNSTGQFVQTPLYDPTTHTTCGPEICNNIVNSNAFDPVSKKVLPLFPSPTNSSPFAVVNNYTAAVVNPEQINQWGLKGDYVINEKNRLSVLYDYGNNTTPNNPLIPVPLGGGGQPSYNKTRNARINYNLILRPNLVNQATLAYNFWGSGLNAVSSYGGRSDWVSHLGLKGFSPNVGSEFPQIVINGLSYNGGGGLQLDNSHYTEVDDSLTWIKGKHTAKFGFEYMKGASNDDSSGRSAGFFSFMPQETAQPGNSSSGIAFASFLLGRVDDVQAYHFNVPSYARDSYYAAFAQDDYKLTRKLTLNLGVRWDLFTPDVHKYNQKSWISPTLPNPGAVAGGQELLGALQVATPSNPSGLNTYYKDFSPRIGLAYALNDKTVIRTGYGIFYAQGNANRLDRGAFVQGYNGTVEKTSPDNGLTPAFVWGTDTMPGFTPTLSPTAFLGGGTPFHSAGTLIELDPTDGLSPYMQNYMFDVERQLPGQMMLSVAYVGNKGTHLASRLTPWDKMPPQYLALGNINVEVNGTTTPALFAPIGNATVQALPVVQAMPVDPTTGDHSPFTGFESLYGSSATLGQSLRTMPQYAGWHRYYEGLGVSDYNALQIKLDKRFSNGLTLLVSYAWSKTLTDSGSIFSTFSSEFGTTTPWNRKAQKAVSFEDIPQNVAIAYVYDLPVGKGKKFLNRGGVVNQVLGGWSISGIHRYETGLPMNIEVPGHTAGLEDQGWGSPNQVLGVPMASAAYRSGHFDPAVDSMLNPAAFSMPCQFCFGTLTPTEGVVRTPGYLNEEFSLMKQWQFNERMSLKFRADFYNAFNRVVFGDNNGAYAAEPTFGQPGFGMLGAQTNQPRTIQFGLRLNW
ncbi:MAG TPA: TonB-dependent receptor [Terriglobia bacterium]|nr:TonB-dependent receptor [Terriglobia bacterium]